MTFNIDKGIYAFRVENFTSSFHSHPAIEIVMAEQGNFTIYDQSREYAGLKFAIVEANWKHKLAASDCSLEIVMIEHHRKMVMGGMETFLKNQIRGIFGQDRLGPERDILYSLVRKISESDIALEYDTRISTIVKYLMDHEVEYRAIISDMKGLIHLSESRLSHLFKEETGISLKKYLIWTRLKTAIRQFLEKQENLTSSSLGSGFYDLPHFSKSFKDMLGVSPARAYNSRIIQV